METHESLTVEPGRFRSHLEWLQRHRFHTASIDEAVAWAVDRRPLPPRSMMITFDDGYADLAEHAFPPLLAAGFSAVVFVVTGLIGASNVWDTPLGGHALLDVGSIKTWDKRGIEFAAHTRTHRDLAKLSSEQAQDEAAASRDDLERLLEHPVRAFAYPYGKPDERTRRIVAGLFPIAFTAFEGRNPDGADRSRLARTMVQRFDTPLDTALRVRLGYSPKEHARRVLGRTRRHLIGGGASTG